MGHLRIYQAVPLSIHQTVRLDKGASHHLFTVLRVKKGEKITLFNGEGGEYQAVITHLDKKEAVVEILSYLAREVESSIHIHLVQGIVRGEKMDFIIQKAVEMGVKKITPLITAHCNVRMNHEQEKKRLKHWQAIAISACEQSGRNRLPEILPPVSLHVNPSKLLQWISSTQADHYFVLLPHIQTALSAALLQKLSTVLLLIGPEGGLSDSETSILLSHGFNPLNLGPRVLRTETASIASIAILQYCYGDFASFSRTC